MKIKVILIMSGLAFIMIFFLTAYSGVKLPPIPVGKLLWKQQTVGFWLEVVDSAYGKGEGLNLYKLRGRPEKQKERLLKSVFYEASLFIRGVRDPGNDGAVIIFFSLAETGYSFPVTCSFVDEPSLLPRQWDHRTAYPSIC